MALQVGGRALKDFSTFMAPIQGPKTAFSDKSGSPRVRFQSLLCLFLHPTQNKTQSPELQLLRKIQLRNQDGFCAQIRLKHSISLAGFCTK